MGIVDEDIERVRAASNLVDIAQEHLALRKVGRRWVGLCPFHAEKTPSFSINGEEGFFYCLAGETRVLTWDGVRAIRELAGGTHRILTERGRWVDAPFYSFGKQPLMKVLLGRNHQQKVIYATPEHRWLVRGRGTHRYERTTEQLRPGQPLAWSFPQNRVRHLKDLSPFGVAHGITYGDGTVFGRMACVDLHGDKDAQLLKWFPLNRTYDGITATGKPYIKVLDLPLGFKQRPSLDEGTSYLAGWLAGYVAADGHVAKDGTVSLNSADRSDLEFVRDLCTRLGIGTYGITTQSRVGIRATEPSDLHRVHFVAEDLDDQFFLLDEHLWRFMSASKRWTRRGWVVKAVEATDRVEEVFCAVVDGTHNFTLEDNILTGNCFGCQAKGDVITFVREVEHLDFVGAVERLAGRVGIQLRYDNTRESGERKRKAVLTDAMEKAVEWYHERLLKAPDGAPARGYLRSRGYDGEVVRRFRIGWAPDDWDALSRSLNLPEDVLRDTGLGFRNKRNRMQDSFRARVLFPIFDVRGAPVAFGGRILPGAEGPKYKNSPQTAIYDKSGTLYGLSWAKGDVVEAGEVIVCEGYTDVIGFALAGLPRAVATCGTALTDQHFAVLKNFARRIVLAFDADAAGQGAAERFYEWERKYELDVLVAALPAGADPGDLAQRDPEALRAAVTGALPFLGFRLERALAAANLATAEGRARAAEAAMRIVQEHPSDLVRDQYLMTVADRCRIDADRLRQLASSGAMSSARATVARPRPASPERDSPERLGLYLAVNDPDSVAKVLHEVLFVDELNLRSFRALASSQTLHEAISRAEPDAGDLLQRLAVEDAGDIDASDVLARLADQAAARTLAGLEHVVRVSNDMATVAAYAPVIDWLKLRIEELRSPTPDLAAIAQLVAWLAERAEEGA